MRLNFFFMLASLGAFAAGSVPLAASARDLEYRGAAGCPSREEVSARLEASAPDGRPARIDVRLDTEKKGFHGDVVLGEGDRRVARSVDAKSCRAVVEALALVIALDRDDADANADANADADADANAVAAGAAGDRDAVVAPQSKSPYRFSGGMAVSGTGFARRAVMPGLAIFTELASERPLFGVGWMRPSARVGALQTFGVTPDDSLIRFKVLAATVEACPVGARLIGETLTLVACARSDIGWLDATVNRSSFSESRFWATAGGTSRLRLATGKPGMWQPVFELGGGVLAPFVRDRFHAGSNTTGIDTSGIDTSISAPGLLWTASLGAGFSFQ